MKVFLTGSEGFIGTHLKSHLVSQGDTITGTSDVPYGTIEIPAGTEVVCHLGAYVRPQESMRRREAYLINNVVGTQQLLEAVITTVPGAKVVLFGSGAQDHLDSWYGWTKKWAEEVGDAYARFDHLKIYRLRLFGVTGVGKTGDVVNDFAEQAARHGHILHGDIEVARDISDVRDVVVAIRRAVDEGHPGIHYIGRGSATPIEFIAKWFGVPLATEASRLRKEEPVYVSPVASVKDRPIEETLEWVYEDWKRKVAGK